jgi:pyridoxine/pyridoxamine 5'-phosphate oxidase
MKGFDENGFKFFTNYDSRKGRDLVIELNFIIKNDCQFIFRKKTQLHQCVSIGHQCRDQ